MPDVSLLAVKLHGQPIGTLTRVGGDRTLFAFNDAYIADQSRPTLGLSFKDTFGALLTDFRPYQTRVMPFFSNLLPEGPLRRLLAGKAGVNPEREFYLLWALGHDLPGALRVEPFVGVPWPSTEFKSRTTHASDERDIDPLRFSLAGVQLKFSAVPDKPGGMTIPASGIGGSWIIKLPSRQFPGIPENEYSMMTLAGLVGINVPRIDLVAVNDIRNLPDGIEQFGQKAFVIERFDRLADGSAMHTEDFAQVFGVYPEKKYEKATLRSILTVLAAETSDPDIAEFVRRVVFSALIGNGDMHLKNWSLVYPDRQHAAIAPAYDLVSTIPYIPNDTMALKISRTRMFSGLNRNELEHLAARAGVPAKLVLDTADETVALFHQHWQAEKHHLPMADSVRGSIDAHLGKLTLSH